VLEQLRTGPDQGVDLRSLGRVDGDVGTLEVALSGETEMSDRDRSVLAEDVPHLVEAEDVELAFDSLRVGIEARVEAARFVAHFR
jgi:hypothetical protein